MSEPEQDKSTKMVDFPSGSDSGTQIELGDEGVDGELIEEGEEEEMEMDIKKKDDVKKSDKSNHSDKDSSSDSPRKRQNSSEHRKHHHHHSSGTSESSSSRKRHISHSGEEGEDVDRSSRRSHRRSGSTADGHSDHGNSSSRRRSRSRDRKRSKHSSRSQRRSNDKASKEEEKNEDSRAKKTDHKKDSAEAEDGEILEDGELSDDDDADQEPVTDTSREEIRDSPVKSSRKDDKKDKSSRDHRDRRKDDDKRKHKKYVDMDKTDEEGGYAAPAWGSGYQGVKKPKTSPSQPSPSSYGKSSKAGHNKGRGASPPGLYDSPSYSEDSDVETMPKSFGLLAGGYVDASVAADEKEGIFKRNTATKKKKKRSDRSGKRKNSEYNKSDGPPIKKPAAERPICKFYRDGKCSKGGGCPFNHDVEQNKRMEVCKYHITVKGCHKEKCLYMHEDFPCKYYHTGAQCFSGDRCKFSHDPLTEETRRALEMRVSAEDIIDMDDTDYEYDYDSRHKGYDHRSRPSLLGSPPRRHDLKKIPSLFEIETHPPGKSPKPSPQPQRPSGFYSEANQSPNPGSGANKGGNVSQLSPNPNNNNNNNNNNINSINNNMGMSANQQGGVGLLGPSGVPRPNMNGQVGGLLRTPGNAAMGAAMMAGNRAPFSGNQQTPSHPVLNMLGAIIREAAIQKVAPAMMNAMASTMNNMTNMSNNNSNNNNPIANMAQNMNNMGGNAMGPNTAMFRMGQGMGPNMMMNRMNVPNSMNNNMNNVPTSMNQNTMGCAGGMEGGNAAQSMQNQDMNSGAERPEDMMDVDYRVQGQQFDESNNTKASFEESDGKSALVDNDSKGTFDENEESRRELSELDQIRRRIQEQIDNDSEEEENEEEDEGKLAVDTGNGGLSPERQEPDEEPDVKQEPKVSPEEEAASTIEVPAHLPKVQRELFMRIHQQHLLREKQKEQLEALKVVEQAEIKVEKDDWYSDSDEETNETPSTNTNNQENASSTGLPTTAKSFPSSSPSPSPSPFTPLTSVAAPTPSTTSSNTEPSQSSTSTINIMQMINAIRKQTTSTSITTAAAAKDFGPSVPESKIADHSIEMSSPASPPSEKPALHLKPLAVDPPVVSAMPKNPLSYAVVKISLDLPKMYSVLPSGVNAADPTYRHDPRVKRHIQLVDKPPQSLPPLLKEKESARKLSTEEVEKPVKPMDPRMNKRPAGDPRLQPKAGSSPRAEDPRTDPRLKKDTSLPKAVDPRLAKRAVSVNMDPRLNRQMSQESGNPMMGNSNGGPNGGMGVGMANMGNMALGSMGNMAGGLMGGPMSMSNMGVAMNKMGGTMNAMGGMMNNQMNGSGMGSMGVPGRAFQGSGGMMANSNMRMNSMGGNMGPNRMGAPMMSGLQGSMQGAMGGPQVQGNMGGLQGSMGGSIGGPQGNMSGLQGNMSGLQGNMSGLQGNMSGLQGNMSGLQGNMSGPQLTMGDPRVNMGPQGNVGDPRGAMGDPRGAMVGRQGTMGGPQVSMGGPLGNNMGVPHGNLGGPQGNSNIMMGGSQGNMGGPQGSNMMGSPQSNSNMMAVPQSTGGARQMGNGPRGYLNVQNNERPGTDTNDPRLGSRVNSDPRGADPRLRNMSLDPRDQSQNDSAPPLGSMPVPRDPRQRSSSNADPRSNRRMLGNTQPGGNSPTFPMDPRHDDTSIVSQKAGFPPLPPLSASAPLPPLPSLSPPLPQSPSFLPTDITSPQPPKDSDNDNIKPAKKFDYRNDPRFKRVKRTAGQRKSSMDYSSPLGQEDGPQRVEEGSGSPQYNGYNRPKPSGPSNVRRQNAPSPTLPDTLQDFDLPELPAENEPDLKVKDLFKTFDPTASPFC